MADGLINRLYASLKLALPDRDIKFYKSNNCIGVDGSSGSLLIYHDPYGYEFYGNFYDNSTRKTIGIIDLARRIGLETQFMYNSKNIEVIFKQIEFVVSKI